MFQAVRKWWSSGKAGSAVRLFLFEFSVVVVGVLAAQSLANWVTDRELRRQVEEESRRLRFEAGRARHTALVWKAALPCMQAQADRLVRIAGQDPRPALQDTEIRRPNWLLYSVEPFTPGVEQAFRARYGDDLHDQYYLLMSLTQFTNKVSQDIAEQWAIFGFLAPDMGQLSASELAAIRAGGVKLRWLLRSMQDRQESIYRVSERMGIAPISSGNTLIIPDTPVTDCAEIWRNGQIWAAAS